MMETKFPVETIELDVVAIVGGAGRCRYIGIECNRIIT